MLCRDLVPQFELTPILGCVIDLAGNGTTGSVRNRVSCYQKHHLDISLERSVWQNRYIQCCEPIRQSPPQSRISAPVDEEPRQDKADDALRMQVVKNAIEQFHWLLWRGYVV